MSNAHLYTNFEYKGDLRALRDKAFQQQLWNKYLAVKNANEAAFQKANTEWHNMITIAKHLYGERSNVYKYLCRQTIESPPVLRKQWDKLMRRFNQWDYEEKQREKRRDYRKRQREAVATLEANGYVEGEHFGRSYAISFAKQVLVEISPGVFGNRALPAPGESSFREDTP